MQHRIASPTVVTNDVVRVTTMSIITDVSGAPTVHIYYAVGALDADGNFVATSKGSLPTLAGPQMQTAIDTMTTLALVAVVAAGGENGEIGAGTAEPVPPVRARVRP